MRMTLMVVTGAMIAQLQSFKQDLIRYVGHIMLFDDKIVTMMGHLGSIQLWNFSASKMGKDKIILLKILEKKRKNKPIMLEVESYPWELFDTCVTQLGAPKVRIICKMVLSLKAS
jgi:hypothetical protein